MDKPDYEFLGDDIYHVLIPKQYPFLMKLMILAAIKTYRLGYKSIDYVLKKYGNSWAEQFDIECSNCGRVVNFRNGFDPEADDFILECDRCGHFFCKNCLDWKHPIADQGGDILSVYWTSCAESKKRGTNRADSGKRKRGRLGQVIRLDEIRKRKP